MREVFFHRLVNRDLRDALDYYEGKGGSKLGDKFYLEAEIAVAEIEANPTGHHFSDGGLRRVALDSFPYHFLYEVDSRYIWIPVLRHDRRHPRFGLTRKK